MENLELVVPKDKTYSEKAIHIDHIKIWQDKAIPEGKYLKVPFSSISDNLPENWVIAALLSRVSSHTHLYVHKNSFDPSLDFWIRPNALVYTTNNIYFRQLHSIRPDLVQSFEESNSDMILSDVLFGHKNDFIHHRIHSTEIVPSTSIGIEACVCSKDDFALRKHLLSINDSTTVQCSNVERTLAQMMKDYSEKCIHCFRDSRNNYHLIVAFIDSIGILHKEKISQSTSYGLSKAMFEKLKNLS
jgi:hypothetical protein